MKALTILQPWASLIACGAKKIETRSWSTKYRGNIAIHAGVQPVNLEMWSDARYQERLIETDLVKQFRSGEYWWDCLPYGAVIAMAYLVDCVKIVNRPTCCDSSQFTTLNNNELITVNELYFGNYTPGRYAWILANVRAIDPIPARGKQRIWEWEGNIA